MERNTVENEVGNETAALAKALQTAALRGVNGERWPAAASLLTAAALTIVEDMGVEAGIATLTLALDESVSAWRRSIAN